MLTREDHLRANLIKSKHVGVEIGPFFSPIAPKNDGWNTIVVDFANGEYLRNLAENHDSEVIRDMAHQVEDVDIVWKGEPLDKSVRNLTDKPVDFLIASHVVEHIPDIITFFEQCDRLLHNGSILSLALPDLRRCFDLFKSPSNLSDILLAYRLKRTIHSPETMFQAWAYCVSNEKKEGAWLKQDTISPLLTDTLGHSYDRYKEYLERHSRGTQEYVDAHAWHFTPASFEMVVIELNALGLINFRIENYAPTDGADFIIQMKKGKYNYSEAELHAHRTNLVKKRFYEMQEISIT